MRIGVCLAAALVAGCYGPAVNPGGPCSPEGACPTGQECRSGVCYDLGAPHDASQQTDSDGNEGADAPDAPDGSSVAWGTPVELTSLESTGAGETDPSTTTDRLTVVFTAEEPDGDSQLYIATRMALTDTFTISLLTTLNFAGFDERSPEITGDGNTIYFTSDRTGNFQVYTSTFAGTWSAPTVRTDLSSTSQDEDVAISPDGLTAAVGIDAGTNRIRIHTRSSTLSSFGAGVYHDELQVTGDIAAPTITNGGEIIYFQAGSPRQLYRATKKGNGDYTNPQPVSELNVTGTRTAAPFVHESDEYMIFEIGSDIYEATRGLP